MTPRATPSVTLLNSDPAAMRDAVLGVVETERQALAPQKHNGRQFLDWDSLGLDVEGFLRTDPPPAEWVFRDFLRAGTVGGIIARGGSGKSRLLLHMMLALAAGKPFGPFAPAGARRVLYLCGEDPQDVLHERIHAIARGMGLWDNPLSQRDILANFRAVSLQGTGCAMIGKSATGNLATTEFHEWLCASLESMGRVDLVVVDPMSRFFCGDENDNAHGTAFISALEAIAKRAGCAILFAHHSSKSAVSSGNIKENTGRGASAIFDGARAMLSMGHRDAEDLGVACQGGKDQGFIELAMTKANYGPLWSKPFFFEKGPGLLLTPTDPQAGIRGRQINEIIDLLPQEGMTERAIIKGKEGKELRESLKEAFPRMNLSNDVPLALALGVETGRIERVTDAKRSPNGKPTFIYRVANMEQEAPETRRKSHFSGDVSGVPSSETKPAPEANPDAGNAGNLGFMPPETPETRRKNNASGVKVSDKANLDAGKVNAGKTPFPATPFSGVESAPEANPGREKPRRKNSAPTGE